MSDKGNVIILPVATTLDLPLERILDGARENELEDAVVLGFDRDGRFYMAGMSTHSGKIMVLLELAKDLLVRKLRGVA